MKVITRAATSRNLDAPSVLDEVLSTDGWRNLMAITAESARMFTWSYRRCICAHMPLPAAPRSQSSAVPGGFDDDIPAEVSPLINILNL